MLESFIVELWVDVCVMCIYGGINEIMKEFVFWSM